MGLMKHVRLLVMIGLCLHSVNAVAGEWGDYIPLQDSEFVTESGDSVVKTFSDAVGNNPALLLLPVAAGGVLAVGHYMKKTNNGIYTFCCNKCENIQKMLSAKCANAQATFEKGVSTCVQFIPVPTIVRGAIETVMSYLFGGIANYASNNKKFISAALLLHVAGRALGQQTPFNMASGGTAVFGYFKGVLDRHHQENMAEHGITRGQLTVLQQGQNALKKEVTDQGEATRLQAEKNKQEVLNKLGQETKALSSKIEQVQAAITKEVSALGESVNSKVDVVDVKVTGLSGQLKTMTKEIVDLAGRFDELHKDSVQKDQRSEELLGQLKKANSDLVSTKESFDFLLQKVMTEMKELAEGTTQQLTAMQSQAISQGESLEQVQAKVDQLLQGATNNNQLLESVQKIQQSNNQQLIDLSEVVKQTSEKDKVRFEFLENMFKSQEASTLSLTTQMSELSGVQENIEKSVGTLFSRMESMEIELSQMKAGLAEVKEGNLAIVKKMDSNQSDMKLKHKKLKEENRKLHQSIADLRVEHAENIGKLRQDLYNVAKGIKDQNDETQRLVKKTNSMVGTAMLALPEPTGNSAPLLSGYNVTEVPQQQSYFMKQSPQSLFTPKVPGQLFSLQNLSRDQQIMLTVVAAAQNNQKPTVMQIKPD